MCDRRPSLPYRFPPLAALAALAASALAVAGLPGCAQTSAAPAAIEAPHTAASAPGPAAAGSLRFGGLASMAAAASAPAAAASAASSAFGAASVPGRSTASAVPAVAPGSPPPFATVIKDARRIDGPLTLWQKDEKVWIELMPEQFGQLFLMSPKIRNGIGEAWVLGGLMSFPINGAGGQQVIEFTRHFNQVRLQARNTDVFAKPGTPESRAVSEAYSNSLLGSTPVVSQPHPERGSVLIEANGLFLNDLLGIGMSLQRGLRQGYGLDRGNSIITAVRGSPAATEIETQNHFYTGSISTSPSMAMPGAPMPAIPRFLPDSRSMLIGLHYSIAPLPTLPMPTRAADPRIGFITTSVLDFSDDLELTPRQRFVNRWRLEKKDPTAEMSEPVKPITFWIDRNVPLAYRETVRAGILEWNKAFEKIGFRNAITVQQQNDDAPFDTLDYGHAAVRWMLNADLSFGAIGPSHVDPRTGEILDADIAFEGMSTRNYRHLRTGVLPSASSTLALTDPSNTVWPWSPLQDRNATPAELMRCMHGELAAEQLGYGLDVLEARGEVEPDSPIAQQFVQDYVKEAIMHEVGHVLGLRHNFRASRVYSEAQLADAEFTRANGTAGSIMEYHAINLPAPGRTGGMPFQTALGPYDFWAIEYAYKTFAQGTSPKDEKAELLRIAGRSNDPLLAYGSDEDVFLGIDPETIQGDLGNDAVAFASKRLAIARELFKRQEGRTLAQNRDYAVLRRSIGYAVNDMTRAVGVLVRQIGGVRTLRDFPGSGRDPLQPVPAQVQRDALDLISSHILAHDGLVLSPALQRRLAPDFFDRDDFFVSTELGVAPRLLELQRAVLAYLMSDTIATRLLDNVDKLDKPAEALQLSELYGHLAETVWGELASGGAIPSARRELQRDHVNRLAYSQLRPSPIGRVDARSLLRIQARSLLARLESAQRKHPPTDDQTRAHLGDSIDTLKQALAATMLRQGL